MLAAPQVGRAGGVQHVETAVAQNLKAELAYVKTVTVTGHFTYQGKSLPITQTTYADLRASIFIGGHLVVSQLLPTKYAPAAGGNGKSIRIKQLQASGPPSVLVDLYSGGAHCCYETVIYLLNAERLRGKIQTDWGDPGYRLVDLDGDGVPEFVSANDAFAYEFTDFADSALPIQIWDLRGGELVDTTASNPKAVASDARALVRAYQQAQHTGSDVRGILSAYVADEATLGAPNIGWELVDNALAAGALDRGYGGTKGNQYIAALRHFLARHGYRA